MAKGSALSANPAEAYRRQMQKKEAKRNKEVRKQMREVAVLHKDTSKMERSIEELRSAKQIRKLTAAEREKLKNMEDELKEVRAKQKEAGIAPKKRQAPAEVVGYDPLAESEPTNALVQYASSSDDSADEVQADGIGETVDIDRDIFDPAATRSDQSEEPDNRPLSLDALPPMPPGTPPLFAADLGIGEVWPPLPSGPSPLYILNHPEVSATLERGRGRGRGLGHERGYRPQLHTQHSEADRNDSAPSQHHRPHPYAPRPSRGRGAVRPPTIPVATAAAAVRPLLPSGTVLSAEPQVRDLKKELTAMVPSRIARKTKHKERQQVLAALPTAPQMVVNAAPDVDGDDAAKTRPSEVSFGPPLPNIPDVRISAARGSASSKQPNAKANQSTNSLDQEYQRFMDNMNKFM
ncbi:hypothetical protein LPJ63_000175 [Coemansia sp. RSA 2711]|nr:hypothetical protein LPJ63_000175 [Coemansia sp. RSA 2711]